MRTFYCCWIVALMLVSHACSSADTTPPPAAASTTTSAGSAASPRPENAPPAPRPPEERLRAELKAWKSTPYLENGASRRGIDNDSFVRAVVHNAFDVDIPSTRDDQFKTGKLVERNALAPGDLVFFEGSGIGPFRSKWVGIFVGHGEVALARKDTGVIVAKLADDPWDAAFKTARRISMDPEAAPPTFNAADYGANRAALLHDIAKAWSGTLYLENGKTFAGIGNDEFVRAVYEAIYETDLPGEPKTWATMGTAVKRDALEAGDIVVYEAVGIGKLFNQRHAGIYIGDGEFVHAVKGAAVTISKIKDARWSDAIRAMRRIDPDVLAHASEPAPTRGRPTTAAGRPAAAPAPLTPLTPRAVTEDERLLREAVEPWLGTPYKIGGTSRKGIDCSAFVREIYDAVFKTPLPRTAEEQETLGAKVDRAALQSGDLIFFRTQGMGPFFKSRHVGLYLGNGEFAQASGKKGVTITRLDHPYWTSKYEGARRVPKKT